MSGWKLFPQLQLLHSSVTLIVTIDKDLWLLTFFWGRDQLRASFCSFSPLLLPLPGFLQVKLSPLLPISILLLPLPGYFLKVKGSSLSLRLLWLSFPDLPEIFRTPAWLGVNTSSSPEKRKFEYVQCDVLILIQFNCYPVKDNLDISISAITTRPTRLE